MSNKRLQVLIEKKEYQVFLKIARSAGISLGEWVRQSLRLRMKDLSPMSADDKIAALRQAAETPRSDKIGDIDQVLEEISRGGLK